MLNTPPRRASSSRPSAVRVEKLKEQHRQLSQRIKDLESRQKLQTRKDDTRRKIIAGALALEHMEKNRGSDFAKKLGALLDEYVLTPRERALFEMPALPAVNDGAPAANGGLRGHFPK